VANRLEADLFVSIHADSAPNRAARGFTVYVSRSASAACRRAGACMVRGLNGSGAANRGIRPADYRVLVHARCPAVLVELGYLSNREEAAQLVEPTYQRRLAEAVVRGVLAFLDGEGSS
jgi:N-acetylmuramoyl-L-alanine amidase